jgi:hypothetical protein
MESVHFIAKQSFDISPTIIIIETSLASVSFEENRSTNKRRGGQEKERRDRGGG